MLLSLRRFFESVLRYIIPTNSTYDILVIHDDFKHKDIVGVEMNGVNYGLIHRDKWTYIEEHTNKPVGAFDDPILAKKLIGQLS